MYFFLFTLDVGLTPSGAEYITRFALRLGQSLGAPVLRRRQYLGVCASSEIIDLGADNTL